MLVTQVNENNDYAIVGGDSGPTKFLMEASAHAFGLMFDNIYTRKNEAVVRETICNAIDAMIDAGKTDPVQVSVLDSTLIVKDFGKGIPDSDIQEVYCTMFKSTKTSDNRMTGGLGLGCKSPFAITTNFTVTSCHNGVRNIYAMHRGDETTGGVPGYNRMSSSKCGEETGLTVSIPIEREDDFQREVVQFATNAGYPIELTSKGYYDKVPKAQIIPTYDYTDLRREGLGALQNAPSRSTSFQCLLGNVVYVVNSDCGVETKLFERLMKLADNMNAGLIIAVKPGTVSVSPSRESLSYDTTTVETLTNTIRKHLNRIEPRLVKERRAFLRARYSKDCAGDMRNLHLMGGRNAWDYGRGATIEDKCTIATGDKIVEVYTQRNRKLRDDDLKWFYKNVLRTRIPNRHKKNGWGSPVIMKPEECYTYTAYRAVMKDLLRLQKAFPGARLYKGKKLIKKVHGWDMDLTTNAPDKRDFSRNLWVADRITDLTLPGTSEKYDYHEIHSGGFHFVMPNFTAVNRDTLAKLCAGRNLRMMYIHKDKGPVYDTFYGPRQPAAAAAVEPPEPKENKSLFIGLNFSGSRAYRMGRRGSYSYTSRTPPEWRSVKTPTAYVDIGELHRGFNGNPAGYQLGSDEVSILNYLGTLYPDTMVLGNAADREYVEKNKLPKLGDAIVGQLKAVFEIKTKTMDSILYGMLEVKNELGHSNNHIKKIINRGIEGVATLFGIAPYAITDEHREAYALIKRMKKVDHRNSAFSEVYKYLQAHMKQMSHYERTPRWNKVQKTLNLERFAALKETFNESGDEEARADYAAVIQFLNDRHTQKENAKCQPLELAA